NVNDISNMYDRLDRISFMLEDLGLLHIKNYEMMLRRLTNNNNIIPLKTLVDVIEPVKIYQRHFQGVKYKQYSPYTRIVDAARPESRRARKFNESVEIFLETGDAAELESLKYWLTKWRENHFKLIPLMELSPIIREIEILSLNLSKLSEVGLEALVLINNNEPAPVKWLDKASVFIEEAKKPYGQTEIHVVEGVEKLVETAK
ncbi:MAG: hypothetical protein KAQ90_07515, partial [Melioribacteraceae bacterium]|nr:hypothetical protein [Melioribacteraceae bacterium]